MNGLDIDSLLAGLNVMPAAVTQQPAAPAQVASPQPAPVTAATQPAPAAIAQPAIASPVAAQPIAQPAPWNPEPVAAQPAAAQIAQLDPNLLNLGTTPIPQVGQVTVAPAFAAPIDVNNVLAGLDGVQSPAVAAQPAAVVAQPAAVVAQPAAVVAQPAAVVAQPAVQPTPQPAAVVDHAAAAQHANKQIMNLQQQAPFQPMTPGDFVIAKMVSEAPEVANPVVAPQPYPPMPDAPKKTRGKAVKEEVVAEDNEPQAPSPTPAAPEPQPTAAPVALNMDVMQMVAAAQPAPAQVQQIQPAPTPAPAALPQQNWTQTGHKLQSAIQNLVELGADTFNKFKQRFEAELNRFSEDLKFTSIDLTTPMINQASLYTFFASLAAEADRIRSMLSQHVKMVEGDLDETIRAEATVSGAKLTESMIERRISVHPSYIEAVNRYNEAIRVSRIADENLHALRHRRDSLLMLARIQLAEMSGQARLSGTSPEVAAAAGSASRSAMMAGFSAMQQQATAEATHADLMQTGQ